MAVKKIALLIGGSDACRLAPLLNHRVILKTKP